MEEVNESSELWRRHCGEEQEARPEILIVNLFLKNLNLFILIEANYFTILYWFCHTST